MAGRHPSAELRRGDAIFYVRLASAAVSVGHLIQISQRVFRVDQMFVGLVLLGIMGYLADHVFDRLVRALLPWYDTEQAGRPRGPRRNLLRVAGSGICDHRCMMPLELKLADQHRTLAITWEDGRVSRLSAPTLRRHSRSASAVRAAVERRVLDVDAVVLTGVEPIGAYAVRLSFSDGHDRGIFPWAYLREIADAAA